jgi:hypothetical protein
MRGGRRGEDRRTHTESQDHREVVIIMGRIERAQALFLSHLQPSQQPTPAQVASAIEATLRRYGVAECAAATAAEYGEHPDTAPSRMRWALAASARLGAVTV